jgi:hypothetical protein
MDMLYGESHAPPAMKKSSTFSWSLHSPKRALPQLIFIAVLTNLMIVGFPYMGFADKDVNQEPRQVVELFCRLDIGGGLLSTENSKLSGIFNSIVLSNGFFSAWDTVTLITGYHILFVSSNSDTAQVLVRYDVIGEIPGAAKLLLEDKQEESLFQLKRTGGAWKIVDPNNLRPHISVDTAIRHLQALVLTGDNDQPEVSTVIEKLRTLK